jgi:hypothetical protein
MSYLFIKICFKEKSLYYFHKNTILKKPQKTNKKTFLVGFLSVFFGFFGWFFLGGSFIANPAFFGVSIMHRDTCVYSSGC